MDSPTYPMMWLILGLIIIFVIVAALITRICSHRSSAHRKGLLEKDEEAAIRDTKREIYKVLTVLNAPSTSPYHLIPSKNNVCSKPSPQLHSNIPKTKVCF